jgi:alkanesulfonate monooxygenase SsuD/methylene tetrahydromethanopterin reductase-like flavin-dependent oxidoreductase (luciferase family)
MNLGFFTMPIHPTSKDWRASLREDREAFILADELGFIEGYVGEHATDKAENITSCALFIATLINATKNIRLGTGTVNMPNAHPVAVASQLAMLDHLLDGRFNFGISPGGLLSDAEAFGNLERDRGEMFLEAIDMVLKIWASDPPYDITGKYWTVSTARTRIEAIGQGEIGKPLQKPHPPIIVTAVAPFSKGLIAAGARGWHPISANFLLPKWVATHWPSYAEGCKAGGLPAKPANWRVAKSVFVADDLTKAKEYATGPNSPYRHYYEQIVTKMKKGGRANIFKADPSMSDEAVTVDQVVKDLVIWGTPDKVTEDLLAFRETTGNFGTLLYAGKDWADPTLARRSMVLMAEKVLPAYNSATTAQ